MFDVGRCTCYHSLAQPIAQLIIVFYIGETYYGKWRVSKKTRERVLSYIEQHGYRPSVIAQSLASSRSFNIGVVLPSDYFFRKAHFFNMY